MVEGHLRETLRRYEEVMAELAAPETHEDSVRLQRLLKEQAELSPLVACIDARFCTPHCAAPKATPPLLLLMGRMSIAMFTPF